MAKKKKGRQTIRDNSFTNSPFKQLKGLSVLDENSGNTSSPVPDQANKPGQPLEGDDTPSSFLEEMTFLGVDPMSDQPHEEGDVTEVTKKPRRVKSDKEEFMEALGQMEAVFKDDWPDVKTQRRASPRRMKQVSKGLLKPQDVLDLHGFTIDESIAKVNFFLQNSVYHGYELVKIITGKGERTGSGPVLRKAVEKHLASLSEQIVEWDYAPRPLGGEGALVVFLRKSGGVK